MLHRYTGLTLAEVEREYILDTLAHCANNRTEAARLLNVSVRGLRNKLNGYAQEGRMPVRRSEASLSDEMENDSRLLWR